MPINVKNLQGINLQPQRQTANTPMMQAAKPQTRSSVGDFLESMGKLNPLVTQITQTNAIAQNDPQKRKDELARIEFQTMGKSSTDVQGMDRTGMKESQIRGLDFRQGSIRATEDQKRFQEWYAQQPPGSVDVDQVMGQYRDEVSKAFGGNTSAVRAWTETMSPFIQNARNGNLDNAIKEQVQQRDNTLQAAFSSQWSILSQDPKLSPAERVQQMQKMVNENQQFIGAGAKNQQALLQQLITTASQAGDPEQIKALGEMEVGGNRIADLMGPVFQNHLINGENVKTKHDQDAFQPKLLEWQTKAQQGLLTDKELFDIDAEVKNGNKMITRGTAAMLIGQNRSALAAQHKAGIDESKKLAKTNWLMSSEPDLVQQAMDGNIEALQSKPSILYHEDGTSTEVASKDKTEAGLSAAARQYGQFEVSKLPADATDQQKAATQADAEMSVYTRNGVLPEAQKQSAISLLKRSNPDMDITDADRAGAGDALRILKMGDGLVDEFAKSDKDKSFLYTLQALSGVMPLDDAIRQARTSRANFDNRMPLSGKDLQDVTDSVVEKLRLDVDRWGPINETSDWSNDMSGYIKRQIRVLQNSELSGDALVDATANLVKANSTKYNGFLIPTNGLPINDPKKLNRMLDSVAASLRADPKYKDKEVTFLRNGMDTTFSPYVIHRGIPIPIPGVEPYTFKQLQKTYNEGRFDLRYFKEEKNRTAREMRIMSMQ